MKINFRECFFVLVALLLLTGCGPSPEEEATMTATMWTPTPVPPTETPTPTPVPYDLTVSIVDEQGAPISGAEILITEEEEGDETFSDESGQVQYFDLPGDSIPLSVTAQGYTSTEEDVAMDRGMNEASVTMVRDPLQLLPSEACQPDQELLYLEDFEDGKAQGWTDLIRPIWTMEQDPEHGTVLTLNVNTEEHTDARYEHELFSGNIVWHMDIRRGPKYGLLWLRTHLQSGYANIALFTNESFLTAQRQTPEQAIHLGARYRQIPDGMVWEHLSIAVYEERIDFYLNDELVLGVNAPEALNTGIISIAASASPSPFSFDNLVVCGLEEPYTPPEVEE